jgi:hypothetical protein
MKDFFENLLDNRYLCKILLPLSIVNVFRSIYMTKREFAIIVESINSNDEFFKSIATLGFIPQKFIPELIAVLPKDPALTLEEVSDIAKTNIIAIIMQFVKSEQLLGIITVSCEIVRTNVVIAIRPQHLPIVFQDLHDFAISLCITILAAAGIIYFV